MVYQRALCVQTSQARGCAFFKLLEDLHVSFAHGFWGAKNDIVIPDLNEWTVAAIGPKQNVPGWLLRDKRREKLSTAMFVPGSVREFRSDHSGLRVRF